MIYCDFQLISGFEGANSFKIVTCVECRVSLRFFAIHRDVEKFEFFRLTLCLATALTIHSASNFTPEESRSIKTIIKVCGSRRFFYFF